MTTVAGVIFLTAPHAGPRVAVRLAHEAGLTLAGGDGESRIAAVWEAPDGVTLETLAQRLLAGDPELLGVYPTFVGEDQEP
ncbi:MAG TPA: hypothetical protein VML50_13995 [Anaeromyxobacter sp.]|nr:hypothetical protein [Anaeromyxobacter sp.]